MKRAEIEKLFDGKLAENVEIKDIVDAIMKMNGDDVNAAKDSAKVLSEESLEKLKKEAADEAIKPYLQGGEKQRVDIILQFAIRDLLQNYMNYSSNIIVLDEIFDALDAKSTQRILELISTRLKDIASVFVISHHPNELQLSYDTEIRIVKNESGISEVVSM